MAIQFYRKPNDKTLYEVGSNRPISATEFGIGTATPGKGFEETKQPQQSQPAVRRDGSGLEVLATSPLSNFKNRTNFLDIVKKTIQDKQTAMQPLTEQKAYWRTLSGRAGTTPFGSAAERGMTGGFSDKDFQLMSPSDQASIRTAREGSAQAHLRGITEEEEYRGGRIEDIIDSITGMLSERDKLAKETADKTGEILANLKKKKELGIPITDQDYKDVGVISIENRTGGTVSWRHNNPGNIKFGKFAEKYGAVKGQDATDGGAFAVFPDLQTGQEAMKDLLKAPSYTSLTLDAAMRRWSGGGYGAEVWNKDYARNKMNTIIGSQLDQLIQAMTTREGWKEGTMLGGTESELLELTDAKKTAIMSKLGYDNAAAATFTPDEWIALEGVARQTVSEEAIAYVEEQANVPTNGNIVKRYLLQTYGQILSSGEIESILATRYKNEYGQYSPTVNR